VVTAEPVRAPEQARAGLAQVELAQAEPAELAQAEPEVLAAEQVELAVAPVVLVVVPEEEAEPNSRDQFQNRDEKKALLVGAFTFAETLSNHCVTSADQARRNERERGAAPAGADGICVGGEAGTGIRAAR
jgi:hypothetical protein